MIKHTMQEWADFTGCKVAVNLQKTECKLFEHKITNSPIIKTSSNWLANNSCFCFMPIKFVSDAATHNWRVLIEQNKG